MASLDDNTPTEDDIPLVKGHPLAWNWSDPKWLPDDTKVAGAAQFARIKRCTSRFAGGIDIWDVVNEATHYRRPGPMDRAPILTRVIREMGVGPYLRTAFAAAREGNPKATLLINDYRTDEGYAASGLRRLVLAVPEADAGRFYGLLGSLSDPLVSVAARG